MPAGFPSGQLGRILYGVHCLPLLRCATKYPKLHGGRRFRKHLPNGPIRWRRLHTGSPQAPLVHKSALGDVPATPVLLAYLGGFGASWVQPAGQKLVGSRRIVAPTVDRPDCLIRPPLEQETPIVHGK